MKAITKQSRLLTTIFLLLGFVVYIVYLFIAKPNGSTIPDDHVGWFIFDIIVFGAIIVGLWLEKARALVEPAVIGLVSINLAINSINYLAYYRYIGDSNYVQINMWWAALTATVCFIALIVFLLSYLFTSKASLFRLIGIIMLLVVSLSYLTAGIVNLVHSYLVIGVWHLSISSIWMGMTFGSLYLRGEGEAKAA